MRAFGLGLVVAALGFGAAAPAAAWGYEGHKVIAAVARGYLTPEVRRRVDALLAADTDPLEPHDMLSASTWADTYRTGHRETAAWHFVDIELDKPDVKSACFGFPASSKPASAGPSQDCLIDRTNAFLTELRDPATPQAERIVALKFVLHFVGDLHQPLHAADNHDRGGNCVPLALGGPRTTNLHSYWDTGLIQAMGPDPLAIAQRLADRITPAQRAQWAKGDPSAWAFESYQVARRSAYLLGSKRGCDPAAAPVDLPQGYARVSAEVVAEQLEKAGVRLAVTLNRAFGGAGPTTSS